jgi:ABC-type antimicrobial peptide transport system permease subunit
VSWFVQLRTREIGVRMALGASPHQVRRLIVRQALSAALPGLVTGTVLAVVLGVVARSAIFAVSPSDPIALGVGITVLLSVVLMAGYLPSIRATSSNPGASLRH